MEWISQNWVWVLFFVAFMAMHMFGHGGHGGHRPKDDGASGPEPAGDGGQKAAAQGKVHRH